MKKLLESLNIKKIVSIDDAWEEEKKIYSLNVGEYLNEANIKLTEEEEDIAYECKTFKELKEKSPELFEKIFKGKVVLDSALENLKTIFMDKISCYQSLDDFKESQPFNGLEKEDSILFFVDINMNCQQPEEDSLINLINLIKKSLTDRNNFCIIVYSSSDILERLESKERKIEYLKEKEEDPCLMAFINPLKKDSEELDEKLKKLILDSTLYSNLYNFLEEKRELDKEIYNSIYFSELFNFNNKVLNVIEGGESVIDLIRRLFLINHHCKIVERGDSLIKRKNLIDITNKYFEKNKDNIIYEGFNKNTKYSITDFSINNYFKDIYTGDLFKINLKDKEIYGLLVNKSCDLIIRKDKRKLFNKRAALLVLEKKFLDNCNSISGKLARKHKKIRDDSNTGKTLYPFETDESLTYYLENKGKIIYIDDFILDMCSLNSTGKINCNCDFSLPEKEKALIYKSFFSKQYFNNFKPSEYLNDDIRNDFIEFKQTSESGQLDQLSAAEEKVIKSSQVKYISRNNHDLKINITEEKINFGIERIGRVHEDKTLLLYQNYLFKISNRGIDTPF